MTHKLGDFWRVDIGGVEKAEIEFTNFENATKRNRPDVRIGDLLYGIVTIHNKHLEPAVSICYFFVVIYFSFRYLVLIHWERLEEWVFCLAKVLSLLCHVAMLVEF